MSEKSSFSPDGFREELRRALGGEAPWLEGLSFRLDAGGLAISFAHEYFGPWLGEEARNRLLALCGTLAPQFPARFELPRPGPPPTRPAQGQAGDPFAGFVARGAGAMTLAAAKSLANDASGPSFLLLCGPAGCGKSHLLAAIGASFAQRGEKAESGQAALFRGAFSKAAHLSRARLFWSYRAALLLDDAQELDEDPEWPAILAAYMDAAKDSGRMVLARLGHAADLAGLEPRLAARLASCLVAELAPADLEERLNWLEAENRQRRLGLNREAMLYLARCAERIPVLAGILKKIEFFTRLNGRPPAGRELESMTGAAPVKRPPGWKDLLELVAARFGLKAEDALGPSRKPEYVLPRQLAMRLCRRRLGLSYPELGRLFGGRDHATVMHSIRKIEHLLDTDKKMRKLWEELESDAKKL